MTKIFTIFGLAFLPTLLFSQIRDPHVKWRRDGFVRVQSMHLKENSLLLESETGSVSAIHAQTGELLGQSKPQKHQPPNDQALRNNLKRKGIPSPLYILPVPSAIPKLFLIYKNEISALNASTFVNFWNSAFPGTVSAPPAVNKELIFIPTQEGTLFAFDLEKGKRLWEYFIGVSIPFKPFAAEDTLYLAGANDFVYGVNLQGRELWRHQCGPAAAAPIYHEGVLFIVNKAGTVYAFMEHEGEQNLETAVQGSFGDGKTEIPKQTRVTHFLVKREIQRLAEQLASKDFRPTDQGPVVAVLLMNDLPSQSGLHIAFTDMLIEAFSNLSKYTVVERTRLNQILAEQKLGLTGAVDPKTAIQLGRLVAANRIVTGSVASIGNFYELNARMTETETGILIKSYSVQVRKDLVQTQ